MQKRLYIPLTALLFTVTSLCAQQPAITPPATEPVANKPIALPDPVATINGAKIDRAELQKHFDGMLENAGRTVDSIPAEQQLMVYHRILDDMITDKLLDEKAGKTEISDKEVEDALAELTAQFPSKEALEEQIKKSGQTMDEVRKEIRAGAQKEKWIKSQIADKATVTEADAEKFYKENPQSFKEPEQVRASHILIRTPEDASAEVLAEKKKAIDAVAERLKKGEDFAAVAKEISEDPGSKENGGDLNFFSKDRMVPEFADTAFKMEKDQVSEPVKTQFGYHIIKVTDKKAARDIPFAEVKDRLIQFLTQQKQGEAAGKLIADLREKADVKIMLPPLPEQPAQEDAGH